MAKVTLMDTVPGMIVKLAEGNPGACNCLLSMLQKSDWYGNCDPVMMILMLDEIGIYGEKIYMLWNDCCDKDLVKMELVLRNHQMGHLSKEVIKNNLSKGRGIPFLGLKTLDEMFPVRI